MHGGRTRHRENTFTPDGPEDPPKWYIADRRDGYVSPVWPLKEAMIADLRAALEALEAIR